MDELITLPADGCVSLGYCWALVWMPRLHVFLRRCLVQILSRLPNYFHPSLPQTETDHGISKPRINDLVYSRWLSKALFCSSHNPPKFPCFFFIELLLPLVILLPTQERLWNSMKSYFKWNVKPVFRGQKVNQPEWVECSSNQSHSPRRTNQFMLTNRRLIRIRSI